MAKSWNNKLYDTDWYPIDDQGVRTGEKDWQANRDWNAKNDPGQINNFSPEVLAGTGGIKPSPGGGAGTGGSDPYNIQGYWNNQENYGGEPGPARILPVGPGWQDNPGTVPMSKFAGVPNAPTYTAPTLQLPGAYVPPTAQSVTPYSGSGPAPVRTDRQDFTAPTAVPTRTGREDFTGATSSPTRTGRTDFDGGTAAEGYGAADVFAGPTADTLSLDPGYQFRLKQGVQALENSAAAKGTVRTGGAQKGLIDYAGESASQEFGNAYGRARDTFDANLDSKYGAYDRNNAANAANWDRSMSTWAANQAGQDTQFAQDMASNQNTYNQGFNQWQANQAGQDTQFSQDLASNQAGFDQGFQSWNANQTGRDTQFGQDLTSWQANNANNFNTWNANTQQTNLQNDRNTTASTAAYDRQMDAAMSKFASEFQGSQAQLAPIMEQWRAQVAAQQAERDRQMQTQQNTRDDDYRKMVFRSDDQFRRAAYGSDLEYRKFRDSTTDAWQRTVLEEERQRFLAQLGAS